MRLTEWNKCISYAHMEAEKLETKYNIRIDVLEYTSASGVGFKFIIYDSLGRKFKEIFSGVWETYNEYVSAINTVITRITDII